ncbi:MAG TPA: site-2 protease family protein [Sedimentisphaerales bacterium]|nr:site-2 protease family protein [Sedimentisphaerales bacterium]
MRWSLNIGKIFGINFRIHVTFFLLLFFIFASVLHQAGVDKALLATLFICAVFVCVLVHEIGHSLIARRFGRETKNITLLPIGGVATMEEMPEKPAQEIAMAIVGPFINLAIAGILYLFLGRWAGIGVPTLHPDSPRTFFAGLIGVNIMLAVFNLIPAFPMDGGRVLRGILAIKMSYVSATSAAVFIGQAIALFFIFFGVFFNWWLALIGIFLYIGAGGEKQHVMLRSLLHEVPVATAMTTDFRSLRPDEPLSHALEHFHHGCQNDFPVIGDAGIEGILTRDRILASIHDKGLDVPVSDIMDRTFVSVDPRMSLDDVYKKLSSSRKTAVAVVDEGSVKGMVCLDGITRYFMIKAALQGIDGESILPKTMD